MMGSTFNMINANLVTTNSYLDEDLAYNTNPCYSYKVQAIFDEGVSEFSNEATACITGVGTVDGMVTELLTGSPIGGATVKMTGPRTYTFTTDFLGEYSGEVLEGTYTYDVSAEGYISETLADIDVDYNTTVTQDFELDEFPYPVTNVVASEEDDNNVLVDWGASAVTISEWLFYDIDVQGFGGIGAEAADYSLIWASKFVPEDLTDYAPGYVTKVAVSQLAPVGDFVTEVRIMSGDGTNVLYAQDVTGTLIEGWQEIVLDEAVPFDNTENLWIGMYAERPGGSFNEPTSSVDVVYTDRYDYFAYNGAAWTQIGTEYGITDQAWMLRGFVSTNPTGKSVALGTGDYKTTDNKDFSQMHQEFLLV